MGMSKRDYERIARRINWMAQHSIDATPDMVYEYAELVTGLMQDFATDNPRFSETKFILAAYENLDVLWIQKPIPMYRVQLRNDGDGWWTVSGGECVTEAAALNRYKAIESPSFLRRIIKRDFTAPLNWSVHTATHNTRLTPHGVSA